MSDSNEHDVGAHEIDKMPNGRLFNLLFGLSALTLLACVGVVQMFNLQVESIESERASKGAHSFREYLAEHEVVREGFGSVTIKEEDASEGVRYYTPISKARTKLLDNPALLEGAPQTAVFKKSAVATQIKDWGGMPKPKAAADPAKAPKGAVKRPTIQKKPPGAKPAGAKPADGAKPAGAKPAGAKPADGAKPAGAKPAGAKPAGAKPAGAKPAGAKPAGAKPAEGKAPAGKPGEGKAN